MKLTMILLFSTTMLVSASLYSQTTRLTLNFSDISYGELFAQIENQSEFSFAYTGSNFDPNQKIRINVTKGELGEILNEVLPGNVTYEIINKYVVIRNVDEMNETASQQQKNISGNITDSSGSPLPGVTVLVKGTSNGMITDVDGNYSLNNIPPDAVLIFSFIGMRTQEILVADRTTLNVTMQEETIGLEEVVAVGYGTVKKENLTGAVTSATGEIISKRPVSSTQSMLQGILPGVQITQGSGEPGAENVSIQIRGKGTFSSAGSNPLVLINGIQGDLDNVNASDIESVSVLKDAASAAIYGAQAANGVILVTTKSGTAGKMNINIRSSYAMKYPTFLWELITNSAEYMELYNEASMNSGITDPSVLYSQETIDLYRNATDRNKYPNTDWIDVMFDPAPTQNHYMSLQGGSDKTQYNISLGYINDQGIMKGYDFEKVNAMVSLNSQINEKIKVGAVVNLNTTTKTGTTGGATDQVLSTLSQSPLYGPKLPDGSGRYSRKAFDWEYVNKNPVAQIERSKRKDYGYSAYSQLWFDFKLSKDLTWYTKGGINIDFDKFEYFRYAVDYYNFITYERMSKGTTRGATKQFSQNTYSNLYSYLDYNKTFNDHHNLKVQAGYSMEGNNYQYLNGSRRNYDIELITELDAGSTEIQSASGTQREWSLMSYFGRLGYNYKERYLFEANLRYDGSSRLTPDSRWGVFPSFSGAWRMTEENFIKNMDISWLENLKVRGSYGQLGNQNIGLYPYQALIELTSYSFDGQTVSTGAAQTGLNNPKIKWETTSITDFGLDLKVSNGLNVTFDWYKKKTSDILRGSQVTGIVGLSAPTVNDGILENTGVELELKYNRKVNSGYFDGLNYQLGANLEHYKNKLVKFGQREIAAYSIKEEGEEYDAFYMLNWIGIFQSEEEIANSPKQFNDATVPGDLKWEDVNKDGVVDNDDRVVMDGRYPKLNYGFNLSASWKSFDIYTLFQGVYGIKFFLEKWAIIPFSQGTPPTVQWRDRWTEDNPSTTMPRIYYQGWESAPDRIRRANSWFLRDASYLRLKNISIGYTVPSALTEQIGFDKIRFFFSGDNLFTITKYHDLDPERASSGWNPNYTQNRVLSFGLDVQF